MRLDAGLNADATVAAVRAALADDLDAPAALAAVDAWAGASVAIDSDDTDAPLVGGPGRRRSAGRPALGDVTETCTSRRPDRRVARRVLQCGARFRHPAVGRTLLPTS